MGVRDVDADRQPDACPREQTRSAHFGNDAQSGLRGIDACPRLAHRDPGRLLLALADRKINLQAEHAWDRRPEIERGLVGAVGERRCAIDEIHGVDAGVESGRRLRQRRGPERSEIDECGEWRTQARGACLSRQRMQRCGRR